MKNKKFHPKNKFNYGYDFFKLIKVNPNLKLFVFKNQYDEVTIDFSNPKAVKELNKTLLFTYDIISFWNFPDENLCPPIPGRLDYILHLADLLKIQKDTTILDIGTGATCIYPLLGVAEFNWNFVASDIDIKSLHTAKDIVVENNLENKIEIRHQKNKQHILKGIINDEDSLSAVICNPPFYNSAQEATKANTRKNRNLGNKNIRNFSGNHNELWYTGGEKAFLHNYLYESSLIKNKRIWFTSLVSKKENVKSLEKSSKKLNVKIFKEIPMQQGNKVTRIVCWQF